MLVGWWEWLDMGENTVACPVAGFWALKYTLRTSTTRKSDMTNKAQTMLTTALTAAVAVLMVDRIIEPAQAQMCASSYDLSAQTKSIVRGVSKCIHGSQVGDGGWIMVKGNCLN